jgi:hypothetical protein
LSQEKELPRRERLEAVLATLCPEKPRAVQPAK